MMLHFPTSLQPLRVTRPTSCAGACSQNTRTNVSAGKITSQPDCDYNTYLHMCWEATSSGCCSYYSSRGGSQKCAWGGRWWKVGLLETTVHVQGEHDHNSLHICNRHTHTDTYMFEHFTGISAKKLCAAGNLHNHDEHCKHKGRELNHREMHQCVSSLCRRLCRHISLKLSISEHLQQKTPSSAKRSFLSNHLSWQLNSFYRDLWLISGR